MNMVFEFFVTVVANLDQVQRDEYVELVNVISRYVLSLLST